MELTKINIIPIHGKKRLRAYVTIELDKQLSITDIRLIQKGDGTYYLDFPSTDKARELNDSNIFLVSELRRNTTDAVLEKYRQSLS